VCKPTTKLLQMPIKG